MNFYRYLLLIISLLLCSYSYAANIHDLDEVYIKKSNLEEVRFLVEVADTNKEKEIGLMNRAFLPVKNGMLFIFYQNQIVEMWMKDTIIPLDIIFIGLDGVIKKIVSNTVPNSKKIISSDTSVIAVLEINAMLSKQYEINVGDKVVHPFFDNLSE